MEGFDFKVVVDTPEFIVPLEHHDVLGKPLYLSNIDQTLLFPVETVYFYKAVAGKSSKTVSEHLKNGLRKVLREYPFLTGRHRFSSDVEPRLEIDCNGAGVQFASAHANTTIDNLGDLSEPKPCFRNFIPQPYGATTIGDCPLVMIQITTFKCGGFVFGMTMMHTCCDGLSALHFLINFSTYCKDPSTTTCVIPPLHDRTLLKVTKASQPLFDHIELIHDNSAELQENSNSGGESEAPAFRSTSAAMDGELQVMQLPAKNVFRSFPISEDMLRLLKKRNQGSKLATSFDVITAHVWQARTKAMIEVAQVPPQQLFSVLYAVDIRTRISPPLPSGFCGNAVMSGCARATAQEICENPLSFCVNEVQEANKRITDIYVKSALNWLEIYKGRPAIYGSNIFISSWWRLPFFQVDFGWGSPVYAGPIVTPMTEFVLFLPNGKNDGGFNLNLALSPATMRKFEEHFLKPFLGAKL